MLYLSPRVFGQDAQSNRRFVDPIMYEEIEDPQELLRKHIERNKELKREIEQKRLISNLKIDPVNPRDLKPENFILFNSNLTQVNIYPIDRFNPPPVKDINHDNLKVYNAINLNAKDLDSENLLYLSKVGGEKGSYIINLGKDPIQYIQEGDILIYFDPNTKKKAKSLYKNIVRGRTHAAIVTKDDDGNLIHVDSPHSWSGKSFKGKSFHVLRLRKYPPKVNSSESFNKCIIDLECKRSLAQYLKDRNEKIAKISFYARNLFIVGYKYKSVGTDVDDFYRREYLKEALDVGRDISHVGMYCSEVCLTAYTFSGVPRPFVEDITKILSRLNVEYFPNIQWEEGLDKKEAVQKGYEHFLIEYNGSTNAVLNAILKLITAIPVKMDSETKEEIKAIFTSSPDQVNSRIMETKSSSLEGLRERPVGPNDYFQAIFDVQSDYFYVGTYLN